MHVCMISRYGASKSIILPSPLRMRFCAYGSVLFHTTCSLPVCYSIRTISLPDKLRIHVALKICDLAIVSGAVRIYDGIA
jgi:hypothetical protein